MLIEFEDATNKMIKLYVNEKSRDKFFSYLKRTLSSVVVLGMLLQTQNIWAHASLIKSDPPRRATLAESPAKVQLWFNEEIEVAYAAVAVVDMNDNVVSNATPEAVEGDPKSVKLALPDLIAGAYKVKFRVLSVDGHVVDSSYSFRIKDSSQ